jgi:hypothetical protein
MKRILKSYFAIQNGLKQTNALLPLLFNFSLEYVIRKVQENQMGPKVNGTHQLLIQEKIKRRLNSDNACNHSVQKHLSSRLLSEGLIITIYKTTVLSLVLYGYMRRKFGPSRDEVTGC